MWLSIYAAPAKRAVYVGKLEINAVANKCDRRIERIISYSPMTTINYVVF